MSGVSVLLHTLALSLRGSLGNGLGEKGNEFPDRPSLIERERGQVRSSGKGRTGLGRRGEYYRERVNLHEGPRGSVGGGRWSMRIVWSKLCGVFAANGHYGECSGYFIRLLCSGLSSML